MRSPRAGELRGGPRPPGQRLGRFCVFPQRCGPQRGAGRARSYQFCQVNVMMERGTSVQREGREMT